MSRSPHLLRSRIALALGLAVLAPLLTMPEGQATPPDTTQGIWCAPVPSDQRPAGHTGGGSGAGGEECAQAIDVEPDAIGATLVDGCTVRSLIGEGSFDPAVGNCCYAATTSCDDSGMPKYVECGCYGRPLVVDARLVATEHQVRTDWSDGPGPWAGAATPEQRERLAEFWLDNARSEHSSVAGFAKLVLDLMALGAPADLVHRAQVAGADELRHTRACYALASGYAGTSYGPRGLVAPPIALAESLAELAVATAREGCVGETIAAHLAAEIAERAEDPAVVSVMRVIAAEEAAHAELSWAILAWALEQGGDAVRDAVRPVFDERPEITAHGTPNDPVLVAHGLLSDEVTAAICREGHAEVVRSLASALLARAA